MKALTQAVVFLILASCSLTAIANYYCVGKVVHLGADTSLRVSNGFGVHWLCDNSDDKCGTWASLALAAKMADRSLTLYYQHPSIGGNQSNGVCNDIGSWVTPADRIYYVQIN